MSMFQELAGAARVLSGTHASPPFAVFAMADLAANC
jgi:hypothetical protein